MAIIGGASIPVGQVPGTVTNDSAAAGNVGEYISSTVLVGSAVSLSTGTTANVTSISLTAGDWNVWGNVTLNPAGTTTVTSIGAWISSTSAAVPTQPNNGAMLIMNASFGTGSQQLVPAGFARFSLSATTTVYLEAYCQFGVSTLNAFGFIGARRVR